MPAFKRTGFGSLQETETDAYSTATDLFENELVENSIVQRKNCIVRPNALSDTGPLHITIPPEGEYFIAPDSFKIHADIKIKKLSKGTNTWVDLESTDEKLVAPLNGLSKNIFRDIDTYIQQKRITLVATAAYPVKAFLETITSYGRDAENGHLRCSYWIKDEPGKHDIPNSNTAFTKRHKFIKKSRSIKMVETLHTEITTLNRYLLPGLELSFILSINEPGFYLQTNPAGITGSAEMPTYGLHFDDLYIAFDRVLINPSVYSSMENKLSKQSQAIYLINRGTLRTKQIPANEQNALWQSMYVGTLPETVTICMLDSRAFNGGLEYNLFNFQHFNMDSISLRVNSQSYPGQPLICDFKNKEAIRAYRHFFDNIGIGHSNSPCLITYEDFLEGATIIPFDLTPDKCALYHAHKKISGSIELDIKFEEALSTGITILALCTYSDRFYIHGPIQNREIILNPTLAD